MTWTISQSKEWKQVDQVFILGFAFKKYFLFRVTESVAWDHTDMLTVLPLAIYTWLINNEIKPLYHHELVYVQ